MQLLKGTGVLVYDPHRPGLKSKTDWWVVVNTDDEICRYYRWWVWRRYMIDLQKPSWGAHVSVIRGGKPSDDKMHLWKKYQGEKIAFEYSPDIRQSGDTTADRPDFFWFLDVWCSRLNEIRAELGFTNEFDGKPIKYHLTIGRTWDN